MVQGEFKIDFFLNVLYLLWLSLNELDRHLQAPEVGLLAPDIVLYLDIPPEVSCRPQPCFLDVEYCQGLKVITLDVRNRDTLKKADLIF